MSSSQPQQRTSASRPPMLCRLVPIIVPVRLEVAFWHSKTFRRAAAERDMLALTMRAAENITMLRFIYDCQDVPGGTPAHPTRRLLITLLHITWRVLEPRLYEQYRWYFVTHMRLYNALSVLAIVKQAQHTAFSHGGAQHLAGTMLRRDLVGSLTVHSLRLILIGTAAVGMLIHAIPTSVPFLLELLLQVACLAFMALYWSSTPASELASPAYDLVSQHLCGILTQLFSWPPHLFSALPPAGSSPPAPSSACSTHVRPWLLVLWTIVFVGFMVPVYVAFCSERHIKTLYLQRLMVRDEAPAQPHALHQAPPRATGSTSVAVPPASPTATATIAPAQAPGDVNSSTSIAAPRTSPAALPTGAQAASPPVTSAPAQPSAAACRYAQLVEATADQLLLLALPQQVTARPAPQQLLPARLLRVLCSTGTHAFWLWLLGALCWHALAAWHPLLAPHIRFRPPLGSNQEWYWQLVCGTSQPCCLVQ